MNERGAFEVWFKQKFRLIDFQEEIFSEIFMIVCIAIIKDIFFFYSKR